MWLRQCHKLLMLIFTHIYTTIIRWWKQFPINRWISILLIEAIEAYRTDTNGDLGDGLLLLTQIKPWETKWNIIGKSTINRGLWPGKYCGYRLHHGFTHGKSTTWGLGLFMFFFFWRVSLNKSKSASNIFIHWSVCSWRTGKPLLLMGRSSNT